MSQSSSTRRRFAAGLAAPLLSAARQARPLRVAAFRADATPPLGEPLIWVAPATQVLDPLWAKGVILDDGQQRIVLCAVDWCGIGSSTYRLFTQRIAEAAATGVQNVSLHSVHQHTAPYIDGDGCALLRQLPDPPLLMSTKALDLVTGRIADAARKALSRLQTIDQIGFGEAEVDSVASARRIIDNGALVTRYSTGGRDPKIAALPEGDIDRRVRTLTFARGSTPVARLHYYATHPQTFCCDGRITADFVGAAREKLERAEGVPQIYFTGCAGDVTVGKYNDTSATAYDALKQRLFAGMKAAAAATRYSPTSPLTWKSAQLLPPQRISAVPDLSRMSGRPAQDLYRAAIVAAFAKRKQPLELHALQIADTVVLHLPGEPMLFFQGYAGKLAPSKAIMVAGYGDISPGYLCTEEAFKQGGYEPSASNVGAPIEAELVQAIRQLVAG